MKRKGNTAAILAFLLLLLAFVVAWGTEAELYFSSDKNGQERVTKVREGDEIWIVVYDPDEDTDCDVRDKVWTDVKVMDVKTGAHIVWKSYGPDDRGAGGGLFGDIDYAPYKGHWPGASAGSLKEDFLEETNHSTGLFVSRRPFQIGTRVTYGRDGRQQSHIVGPYAGSVTGPVEPTDFQWGGYLYADSGADADDFGDNRVWVDARQAFEDATTPGNEIPSGDAFVPPGSSAGGPKDYMLGRFENMDTLVGLYVDQDDPGDVALALAKIFDSEAEISWSREVYPDGNEAATITVVDPDENVNCSAVDMVPVFVLVNPGSWNWAGTARSAESATDFWALNRFGGVRNLAGDVLDMPLVWYTIYDSGLKTTDVNLALDHSRQPNVDGTFYIEYPNAADGFEVSFDTDSDSGVTRVMFYATETGKDTGVFTLRLNSILRDLGFNSFNVRDVLVAYYVDPNDQDDFKVATAYISERAHSTLRFTDYARKDQGVFWIGRDPVYIEVVDANANVDSCCPEQVVVHVCDPHEVDDTEWLLLDEMSSNSPVFFTHVGMRLISVWEASGVGDPGMNGGYSLELDNWDLEAFNEDSIYVRYNDVVYAAEELALVGDRDTTTAFPPAIERVRVANDVSFAVFEVGDTQVYDGDEVAMYFLDRQGNRISGYANSDCVFIEVIDPDQNEDRLRRERIAAFWDGTAGAGQNAPLGPMNLAANHKVDGCGYLEVDTHIANALLGDTNIFNNGTWGKLYVLNPRNGRWAPLDLFETGVDAGDFVSVTCIDLVNRYDCAPNLGVLPGDTILAAYQDPSNHSDIAWISIKVSVGGGEPVPHSRTAFTDATGASVAAYVEGELVYVRVDDTTLAGAGTVPDAVTIDGGTYDLAPLAGASAGAFITVGLDLGAVAGESITAAYVDPTDPTDTSSATITVVDSVLVVERFYAGPNPFDEEVAFAYVGSGMADLFTVSVYDLAGHLIWSGQASNALSVEWDGRSRRGDLVANGAYVYVVSASAGTDRFVGKGTVFVNR